MASYFNISGESATAKVTITDYTELNAGDKVNLIAKGKYCIKGRIMVPDIPWVKQFLEIRRKKRILLPALQEI